jgi:hypothetical protein
MIYGCFPKMGRPPNHPRMTILVVKPMVSYGIGDPPLKNLLEAVGISWGDHQHNLTTMVMEVAWGGDHQHEFYCTWNNMSSLLA